MIIQGQVLAGLCKTFATYLVCQGLVFGLGSSSVFHLHTIFANISRPRYCGLPSGNKPKQGVHADQEYLVPQILVASQPLLAQWFDRRLSLAQVEPSLEHPSCLEQILKNNVGNCKRGIRSRRSHLCQHHPTPHREIISEAVPHHQWLHLGRSHHSRTVLNTNGTRKCRQQKRQAVATAMALSPRFCLGLVVGGLCQLMTPGILRPSV